MKESLFQRFYIFLYETEIVTFQKIVKIREMSIRYSSDGGKKDKTK